MRKVTAVLISSIIVSFFSNTAFAIDASSIGTTRVDRIQRRVETRQEKMASREAQLRAKLQNFKDKRKAEIADRVNTNLNRINQNQTQQMLKHLEKMTTILNRLEARVNQGTPDIKDPAAAKEAIASASASIASATSAVQTQALNDYTITVTSEATVKANAKASRDKLHADLVAVRKQVIDAKKSVSNAIRVAKSGKSTKEGTSSGNE